MNKTSIFSNSHSFPNYFEELIKLDYEEAMINTIRSNMPIGVDSSKVDIKIDLYVTLLPKGDENEKENISN